MEAYILDSLYRRQTVVDKFESLIWTERFSTIGDFELKIQSTLENRNRFTEGTLLATNESYYVMTVETVVDAVDSDGTAILTITGPSLENILDNRLASATFVHATGGIYTATGIPKWVITNTPVNIANKIFHDVCVLGIVSAGDIIPFVNEGSIFPADTIPFPTDVISYEMAPKTVYAALKDVCDLYLLGFRLIRDLDTTQLYFDVYAGSDRTPHQSDLPAVVFSPDLDNLQNTSELKSIAAYKNVAYVMTPVGLEVVYELGTDPSVSGFNRRALVVQADDITDTDPTVASARMTQRGIEELAKNRKVTAFDGEISQNSQYKYGRDYNLGDLVQVRNIDGVATDMKVTEHIFVSDAQGDRSYPTLSVIQFITPGSWITEPIDEVWEDLGTTDYWGTRP